MAPAQWRYERVEVGGRSLCLVRAVDRPQPPELAARLGDAGLPAGAPVVVLVGGADGMDEQAMAGCARLFDAALVPVLEEVGAVLVDGGTDSGVMALAGAARHRAGARQPQVGVVADGTVRWPGRSAADGAAALEPHHTHVVVVPGDGWGDEAPWLSAVATAIAGRAPSVTVLANGGAVAYDDVQHSLAARRPVLVLAGTGRTAGEIVAARSRRQPDSPAGRVAGSELISTVPDDPAALAAALRSALGL